MKTLVSRTLSVHNEHELLLKLEIAGLNDEIAQKVIDSKNNELGKKVVNFIRNEGKIIPENQLICLDYFQILSDWKRFYQEIFNLKTDFSGVKIPEADDREFPWFVCIPENFLTETVFSGGKPQFKNWKYTDKPLDEVLNLSFGRDSLKGPYIVRCKANYDADEDLKNLSANKIAEMKINTLTLKERILLGRFVFFIENKLIDQKTITLCAGSRDSDGHVPSAGWVGGGGRFRVCWYGPGCSVGLLRSRVAVS